MDYKSYNRYSYCFNNPLAYVDPDGRISVLESMKALWFSPFGGSWSNGFMNPYTSYEDALRSGVNYLDDNGGWESSLYPNGANVSYPSYSRRYGWWYNPNDRGLVFKTKEAGIMLVPRTQKAGNDTSFWTSSLEGGAVPQEQGSEIPSWAGWLNNTVGAGAYDATVIGGSMRLTKGGSMSPTHYASAWTGGGKARITTYNLTKIGKGIGYCTSFLGVGIGTVTFAVSGCVVTVIGFNNKWLYGSHRHWDRLY